MTSLWRAGRAPFPGTPFEPGRAYDDVVVGAGLTGLTTALLLAEAGRRVVVLEARDIGALASGNTTGKLSLLQGSRLSTIRKHHSRRILRAYVDMNRDGQDWLLEFCERAGVPVERRTAYSYAQHPDAADTVDSEYHAAREAGLPVSLVDGDALDLPFPFAFGVALPDQAQFDSMDVLDALAGAFVAAGGVIHTGARVVGVRASDPAVVRVEGDAATGSVGGAVTGRSVVLATGTPILDRGLYFAKLHGMRSYATSFVVPGEEADSLPLGMFLSIGDPDSGGPAASRSVRSAPHEEGGVQLVIGGNGHEVGRPGSMSEEERVEDLVAWTGRFWPGARLTHSWSAQDYESHNLIPFVGALPRGRGRVYIATGYAKWGLTNGVAAALRLRSEILGEPRSERAGWHQVLGTRLTKPADIGRGASAGAAVGLEAAKGWLGAERRPVPVPRPAEGEGVVANTKGRPVGISTVDGVTCAVSAVCPHLGGVLEWNDAERSWDCPLHSSRFAADGTRLEGPAVEDLPVLPRVRARHGAR
ncbi:FAD-dependent oxidoreductase [Herbiconiux solani]|uniref:FAD-dependent oxidoreductase n=1 Tax=Herbiconiux solani TaxID=661329 RepID=UPI0008266105|nr:FAD-dependent oxidoreductase [Herbiconiux solani]